MPTLSSRRKPWPWDARIAVNKPAPVGGRVGDFRGQTIGSLRGKLIGTLRARATPMGTTKGFMLLPQPDSSLMIGRKQTNLENLYPSTAEYDSAPVYRERTFMFRPTAGLGEPVQSSAADRRYHYGINVWCSGGLFGKGPLSHQVVPASGPQTGILRRFVEGLHGGVLTLFYLVGQRVYRRSDDSATGQVISRERAGHVAMDAARFTGGYATPVDGLYVAWDDGVVEEYNGSTWTACVLPASFGGMFLEVVGDELWAADQVRSVLRKCTADPKVAGSWSGPILIGNPSERITAIRQTSNCLVIFKESGGVFSINSDGSDNDLYPGIESTINADNGRTAWAWLGSLWFRVGHGFFQLTMTGGPVLTPAGPGRNLSNSSEVKGPVQAWCGWGTQMAFAAIYNASLNNSYLLSYGNWIPREGDTNSTVSGSFYAFADQYDGALVRWKNRRVTALFVSSVPTDSRLYVGFADGNYDYIKLVAYPLAVDAGTNGAEYTSDESYMVTPLHHAMFQADTKHWTGVSCFGPKFDTGDEVFVRYRVKGGKSGLSVVPPLSGVQGDWVPLGNQPMTHSGERTDAVDAIAGQSIELKISFDSSATSSTPILEGVGLHERLVPRFRRDYSLRVDANDLVARRDGSSTRQSGAQIREILEEAAAAPANISIILPDERVNDVAIFSYEEHQVAHAQRGGLGWAISVQATQFTTVDQYGIIGRLHGVRIGDLRGYQISALRYM